MQVSGKLVACGRTRTRTCYLHIFYFKMESMPNHGLCTKSAPRGKAHGKGACPGRAVQSGTPSDCTVRLVTAASAGMVVAGGGAGESERVSISNLSSRVGGSWT